MFNRSRPLSKRNQNYQLLSIGTFCSIENFYQNEKRLRRVFLRDEAGYLYTEVKLHNNLFKIKDWNLNFKATCREETDNNNIICVLDKEFSVRKDIPTFIIREGWGVEQLGGFWGQGKYSWDLEVNDEFVGSCSFWIEEENFSSIYKNPFFELIEHKLYESGFEDIKRRKRVYTNSFKKEQLEYINQELKIYNYLERNWPLEIICNIVNEFGERKASCVYFEELKADQRLIHLDSGYGSKDGGYWEKGSYKVYSSFMGKVICQDEFEIEEEDE